MSRRRILFELNDGLIGLSVRQNRYNAGVIWWEFRKAATHTGELV